MIIMPVNTWTEFKTLVIGTKQLKFQYTENSTSYELYANESVFVWNTTVLKATSDCTDFEANHKANGNQKIMLDVGTMPAFASKTFGTKKLFKRVIGFTQALTTGANTVSWTCSFPWVKLMALELVGGEIGDIADLKVKDSNAGLITGVPNYLLNQFGWSYNIYGNYSKHYSEFDADLYAGLVIEITYTSISNKTIGVNIITNEVKT